MNIQGRLKKMEKQIDVSAEHSEYCGCKKQRTVREPGDPPFPETCELCGKPLLIFHVTSTEMRRENK